MAWIIVNRVTTTAERENNAKELYRYVLSRGGNINVAAALSANAEKESWLSPGVWQNLTVNPVNGYGLFQWTPSTKLTDWCADRGIPSANGDSQMQCLYEATVTPFGQWFNINKTATHKSEWLSGFYIPWTAFLTSSQSPSYLAAVFACSYERPAAILYGDRSSQETEINERKTLGDKWYRFLSGGLPAGGTWNDLPINIKRGVYASQQRKRRTHSCHYQLTR